MTDVGLVRKLNEDNFICSPQHGYWLVVDGMGGQGSGDLAADLACSTMHDSMLAGANPKTAIIKADRAIRDAAASGQGSPQMGCTATVMQVLNDRYNISWVGDCRAYMWDGELWRLTSDHSYVQELVNRGELSEEQARIHPDSNIVTRAVGGGIIDETEPDQIQGNLRGGQIYLLCSDGLTSELSDEEIEEVFAEQASEERIAGKLVEQAKAKGGKDNITVVCLGFYGLTDDYGFSDTQEVRPSATKRFHLAGLTAWLTALLLGVVLAAGGYFYYMEYMDKKPETPPNPEISVKQPE